MFDPTDNPVDTRISAIYRLFAGGDHRGRKINGVDLIGMGQQTAGHLARAAAGVQEAHRRNRRID
ncbi:MAG: hypothetical protein R2932_41815 [Caldilineaceae bacterium]